jgi:antitoxin VapB
MALLESGIVEPLKGSTMSILSAETEALIKERAILTGKTPDDLVREAIRLAGHALVGQRRAETPRLPQDELLRRMKEIADRTAALPVLDARTPDEIIGYDEFGVPS